MSKIEDLNEYIKQCEYMRNNTDKEIENYIEKIIYIYEAEIPTITNRLDMYSYYDENSSVNYKEDLEKVKAILGNHRSNIEIEEQKRKDELEIARLKQTNIKLNNSSSSMSTNTINISIEQVMDCISEIPDEVMSKDEKDDLEDKVSGIDAAIKSGKKDKAKEKILSVLKFLADKGADALIAMLPYLGQMAGLL